MSEPRGRKRTGWRGRVLDRVGPPPSWLRTVTVDVPLRGIRRFFRGLKRRSVHRVAVTYRVAAFSANEAVDLLRLDEAVVKIGDGEAPRWTS